MADWPEDLSANVINAEQGAAPAMTAAFGIIGEFGACRRGSHGVSFSFGTMSVTKSISRPSRAIRVSVSLSG